MFKIKRKIGESFTINNVIEIKVLEKNGDEIQIGVCVPESSKVLRADSPEIFEALVGDQSTTVH